MYKRIICSILVIINIFANISYSGPLTNSGEIKQALVWNIGSYIDELDPGLNGSDLSGNVINNTFEGLMREKGGELTPAMAESYEVSEDGMTYIFKIREGAKWSDGKAVTANDFEYAWERVLDPETGSEYSWIFGEANVKDFQAVDKKTFVVNLEEPTPWFLGMTTFYTFFPVRKDMVEAKAEGLWAKDPKLAISNGPFKLTEYKIGEKLVLEKNENYWNADSVTLEKIDGRIIIEEMTAMSAYNSNFLHINDRIPISEIPRLMEKDPTFQIFTRLGTYYYTFNLSVEPLDDYNVRRALTLAIDREAIVKTVIKAGQEAASTMIPSGLKDAEGNIFNEMTGDYGISKNANVKEAQKLLKEAGYENGEDFPTLKLMYNTNWGHKKIAEAIQKMWKKNLGIDVMLVNQEWSVFQDTRKRGDFGIARCGWIGDYADPVTFLGMFRTGSPTNYGDWANEEYDKILENSMTASGEERFEMLFEADKLLMEDLPVMPIYHYTDTYQISDSVQGWDLNAKNIWFFGNVKIVK